MKSGTIETELSASNGPSIRLALQAMRTRWELVLPVGEEDNPFTVRAAGEEALSEIERAEQMLSAFRPDSDLFRLNHDAQSGVPIRVPGRLFAFLLRIQHIAEQSGGAFDPAIGPLVSVWENVSLLGRLPTESDIRVARRNMSIVHNLSLDDTAQTVTYRLPGVRLNMGAVGKGWAADRAVESLRENGVTSALLHGGTSTVYGLGTPSEDETKGWSVALQNPLLPPRSEPLGVVHLRNAALGVSAVHGKTYWADAEGRTFGHVLDPRTGWPVQDTLLAAVLLPYSMEADALSTALLVLGSGNENLLGQNFPDARFCVVNSSSERTADEPKGVVRVVASPSFFT